jgi:hypothetical protein
MTHPYIPPALPLLKTECSLTVVLFCSMTSLYEKNYLQGGVGANVMTTKIFTAWDYSVTDREACFIKQQSIATDIEVKYTIVQQIVVNRQLLE